MESKKEKYFNESYQEIDYNALGNYIKDEETEYYLYLFKVFCEKKGYNFKKIINYFINKKVNNVEQLKKEYEPFKIWLEENKELINKNKEILNNDVVNTEDDNIIELNCGIEDTMTSSIILSPYANTINSENKNSILYRERNEVLVLKEDGSSYIIPENKTFILKNPFSINQILYILEVLGGTNNKIVINYFGKTDDVFKDFQIAQLERILKFLDAGDLNAHVNPVYRTDGDVYSYSFEINTKYLRKDMDFKELLTKRDKENYFKKKVELNDDFTDYDTSKSPHIK